MWKRWFFVCIHNWVSIFWFITKTIKKFRKSQNEFPWTNKHGFWQDYFLHMWPAPKVKHFEPFEHNFFSKWLKKWELCFKISNLWNFCTIWLFINFIHWTCTFIKRDIFFGTNFLKSIVWLYAFLLITLKIKCNWNTWYN
jgi:hypothetical protein